MKTLVIVAHPSRFGFSQRIATEYARVKKEKGWEVELLDLYDLENRQDFLIFEDIKKMSEDPSVKRMQAKISESDELIFCFPLWWFGEPAVLKNFWDKNFSARYAYRYEKGRPVGLLKGKSAKVFITADGPNFFHWLLSNPVRKIWWISRLRFCGIKMKSFTMFDRMYKRGEDEKKVFLEKVSRLAEK